MLEHCAANRKRWFSALPNVGPYIYDVKVLGFTRSSVYIYDISRLWVNIQKCKDTDIQNCNFACCFV
jgi:hypothetical protein